MTVLLRSGVVQNAVTIFVARSGTELNGERRKTTTMGTPLEQCYLFFIHSSFRSAPLPL